MAAGILLLFLMVGFLLVPLGLLVFALVDLVGRSDAEWHWSSQDRLVWLLIVVFVGLLGPILYLAIARPRLDTTRAWLRSPAGAAAVPPPPGEMPPPPR